YWEDVQSRRAPTDSDPTGEGAADPQHVHFLGIRASDELGPLQIGVKLRHVFAASPAARAGLETGDELRMVDGKPVRTATEVRAVLAETQGGDRETVPIVYFREGQQYQSTVDLVTRRAYLALRRQRLFVEAGYSESEFPFFFRRVSRALPPPFLAL